MTLRSRWYAPVVLALVLGVLVGALGAVPAAVAADGHKQVTRTVFARSAYLCIGYVACREAGMPNAGYAQANQNMYWRMYAGHNCTNYAAYRMVKSGLPNVRPWSGAGNATYWGSSMPDITNGTPAVGAVAWWRANTGPAGSAGHVAYVEKVVSANEIVISQDSWGGDFSWAVVTRSSGDWPSGFIHFNDKPMTNVRPPVVSGIAKVGAVLSATAGRWRPGDATVSYQWYADGQPITGAIAPSLKLTRAQLGDQVSVTTTASKLGYPTESVNSTRTAEVEPGALKATEPPTISGTAQVDSTLTATPGSWTPAPSAVAYQWLADGRPIAGATAATLPLTPDLVDETITVQATASRAGYNDVSAISPATAPVAPGTIRVTRQPAVVGTAKPGEVLELTTGSHTPTDANVAIQWLRDGAPVLNATGPAYQVTNADLGARISARVTLSKPGYTTEELRTPATLRVKATPRMKVAWESGAHPLRLTVTVTARGVAPVTGQITVHGPGGFEATADLRNGVATVALRGLPEGRQTLRIRYSGSDTVERKVGLRTVRVG